MTAPGTLGWLGILRLGLVQTALGAIIVLTTSTMNRVMVVELALPAMLPGFLVALHHVVQMSRPRFGYGSDLGGRRTPWIVGGMLILALGGIGAACATSLMAESTGMGVALAVLSFLGIGLGAGACGTSLLVMLAKRVALERKAAAATVVWVMMIAGFAVTAGVAGHFLDPYSPARLVEVTTAVALGAVLVTLLAVYRLEGPADAAAPDAAAPDDAATPVPDSAPPPFAAALREVWRESEARRFTVFVFVSMLAYSAQDLILEPFAGTVFGMTPGESTQLAGVQHGGVLLGMIMVALAGRAAARSGAALLQRWTIGGCLASALALLGIAIGGTAVGGTASSGWPLTLNVFALGVANGAFAVAAIASMMTLAGHGQARREGLRMGLWGAAQAIAFALGGFLGTVAIDIARALMPAQPALAYGLVFASEAALFLLAAVLAARVRRRPAESPERAPAFGAVAMVEMMDRG
jgi:BCD family chlorophyll transporter-like MFS transporter